MEHFGVVSEVNWNSFDATMSVEESEIMAQLLGPYPFDNGCVHDQSLGDNSMFWSEYNVDPYYSSYIVDPSLLYSSQDNCGNANSLTAPNYEYENYYQGESIVVPANDASLAAKESCIFEEHICDQELHTIPNTCLGDQIRVVEEASGNNSGDSSSSIPEPGLTHRKSQPKRKLNEKLVNKPFDVDQDDGIPAESPKQKVQVASKARKSAKNGQSKKAQKKVKHSDEDDNNALSNGLSSSCYSSEDDSNASQELNGGGENTSSSSKGPAAITSSGKTRASRGSATDPQSLYARKRRERINERLRILQNLVPNGTKVDISTMLEEAVQYVKFLQLQIKLLSSDEMWMYAPLAYNGMDIGLDLKISPPKQ